MRKPTDTSITLNSKAMHIVGQHKYEIRGTDCNGKDISCITQDSLLYDAWYTHFNSDSTDTEHCFYSKDEVQKLLEYDLKKAAIKRAVKSVNVPHN